MATFASNQQSDSVLVTGATGAVGPSIVQALHGAGYRVRSLSLDGPSPGLLPEDVESLVGDVTDPSTVTNALEGVGAVMHLAALLHVTNPASGLRAEYERVNVRGTATLVEAAVRSRVKRIVFFSTIAVYGPSEGRVLDEDTPPRPATPYAKTKLAAEQIVLRAIRQDGQPLGTVLRLASVYGARVKGNYHSLVQALARGRFIPLGKGRNRRSLIYDCDVARAGLLAVQHPSAAGRVHNLSDGRIHSMNEILSAICEALGRKPPRFSLPVGLARSAASFLEAVASFMGFESPIVRATVDKYIEDVAVESQRIQTQLGFVPQFDLAAGWRETVCKMRQGGEL